MRASERKCRLWPQMDYLNLISCSVYRCSVGQLLSGNTNRNAWNSHLLCALRWKHVICDMFYKNGSNFGRLTPGRLIKQLYSIKTHPYANLYLELTSGESGFSNPANVRLPRCYQWEWTTVTHKKRSSQTVENIKWAFFFFFYERARPIAYFSPHNSSLMLDLDKVGPEDDRKKLRRLIVTQ